MIQIQLIHNLNHEPRQMIVRQIILHARRKHVRRVSVDRDKFNCHLASFSLAFRGNVILPPYTCKVRQAPRSAAVDRLGGFVQNPADMRHEKYYQVTEYKEKTSVLFVCMGNICRSPTAEGVFRKVLAERAPDLELEIDSAGTHSYHVGEPPDERAQMAAKRRGIDLSRIRARGVASDDFEVFDYILAMDMQNLSALRRACPKDYQSRLQLYLDYAPGDRESVPDPYYGGPNGFEHVLDLVEEAAHGLIAELRKRA